MAQAVPIDDDEEDDTIDDAPDDNPVETDDGGDDTVDSTDDDDLADDQDDRVEELDDDDRVDDSDDDAFETAIEERDIDSDQIFDFDDEDSREFADIDDGFDENELDRDTDEFLDEFGYPVLSGEILAINIDDTALEMARDLGFGVSRSYRFEALDIDVVILSVPDDMDVSSALQQLREEMPDGLFELNHLYTLSESGRSTTPAENQQRRFSLQYQHDIRVGLIDTAVDRSHPSLRNSLITAKLFVDQKNIPLQHGTAVASMLVGQGEQVSGFLPRAHLYSAAVFNRSSDGEIRAEAGHLVAAINWMVEHHVCVINMSLAGPPNALLELAVKKAADRGHIIVAAVGNQGPAAPPLFPAAYEEVVAVTAFDMRERIYRYANRGHHLDFAAMGVEVAAADDAGGIKTYSGTSFAAPEVTALLAVGLTKPSHHDREQLLQSHRQSAHDLGLPGFDPVFGYGSMQLLDRYK